MERSSVSPSQILHLFNRETVETWLTGPKYTFQKGDLIYYSGKLEDEIYLIIEGNVRLFHQHANGKECILGILSAGDFIDITSIFTDEPSDAYAIALTDGTAVRLAKIKIKTEVIHTPELSEALFSHFASKLQEIIQVLGQVAYEKVEERLYNLLERLADPASEESGWHPLPSYLTHKDLAGMIASTRETVTFLINKFIQHGTIRQHNERIWVHSKHE